MEKLNRQQTAEKLRGVPLIQLDYETGEYIDEYPSITSIALDYNIPLGTLLGKLNKDNCCMVKIPKHQLLLIRKHHYESMFNERGCCRR